MESKSRMALYLNSIEYILIRLSAVENHITILGDEGSLILGTIPFVLDGNQNTCIDLRYSPPMFWMAIQNTTLFNMTSNRIQVSIIGENIECQRTAYRYTRVGTSSPISQETCSHQADISFCKPISQNKIGNITYCDNECICEDSQCSSIHIIMSTDDGDPRRLCELAIHDV